MVELRVYEYQTIYPRIFIVAFGGTPKDLNKLFMFRDGSDVRLRSDCEGITFSCIRRSDNNCCEVVWFEKLKFCTQSIVAHECFHIMCNIYRDVEATIEFNNQEPSAYFLGWLVDKVSESLKNDKARATKSSNTGNKNKK